MRISDVIEDFLKDMLKEEDELEIQRNELANKFNCVPSQINYVISTRFKPSQGYYVESIRGGGGHITIRKVNINQNKYIEHVITHISDKLTSNDINVFLKNFLENDIVTPREAKLIKAAISDVSLSSAKDKKDILRSEIFKNMLINLL